MYTSKRISLYFVISALLAGCSEQGPLVANIQGIEYNIPRVNVANYDNISRPDIPFVRLRYKGFLLEHSDRNYLPSPQGADFPMVPNISWAVPTEELEVLDVEGLRVLCVRQVQDIHFQCGTAFSVAGAKWVMKFDRPQLSRVRRMQDMAYRFLLNCIQRGAG